MRPQLGPAKSSTSQAGPAGNAMALVEGPCSNTIMGEFLVVGGGGGYTGMHPCDDAIRKSKGRHRGNKGIVREGDT